MNSSEIGKRLIQLRGSRTQKEVADAVRITPMAYSYYESGDRIPRDEIKVRIAKYYGVSVESLFFTDKAN